MIPVTGVKKARGGGPGGPTRSLATVPVLRIVSLATVAILVFLFVLPSPSCHETSPRSCGSYLFTPGFTVPHWDIVIVEGNPLEIYCVLDLDHDLGKGHNATDLRFYRNGTLVEPEYLTVVNETTLRFYVEKPLPTKFSVFCNLKPRTEDKEIFVCLNIVTIKTDTTLYDTFRIILGVLLLLGVGTLGSWYAGRFYRHCKVSGRQAVKTQADVLPSEDTRDPSSQNIMTSSGGQQANDG